MDRLAPTLVAAYQDLLQLHDAAPRPEIRGSVIKAPRGGNLYWAVRRRLGERVEQVHLGPDDPPTRDRARRIKEENAQLAQWTRQCSDLVAAQRGARQPAPDKDTARFLRALGEAGYFDRGGALGGTHAFRAYGLELGAPLPPGNALLTRDIDLITPGAVRLASPGDTATSMMKAVAALGITYRTVFPMEADSRPKFLLGNEAEVEFLGPRKRGGAAVYDDPVSGERAQALAYMEYALEGTIPAVLPYREGVPVRVPAPERFALHKLLVSQARQGRFRAKAAKDRAQSAWLIGVLAEDRPYELHAAQVDLEGRGRSWRRGLAAALTHEPGLARTLDALRRTYSADNPDPDDGLPDND